MNRRALTRTIACTIGCAISLLLAGAVLVAIDHVSLQATSTVHTALTGPADWEGDWEISARGADPSEAGSQTGTDRVTIPFTGTALALQVRRGPYRGNLFVGVDGEPANLLPRDERGAYLVLTSPDYASQIVTIPVASELAPGDHTAVVVADRGWDQWPLVGWEMRHEPSATPLRWALVGLGILGAACLLGALGWGARIWKRPVGPQSPQADPLSLWRHPTLVQIAPWAILAATAIFYFSPWLPLTIISGLTMASLILLRPDLGLALVAATAPFFLHPRTLPLVGHYSLAEIATLLSLLSWGFNHLIALVRRRTRPGLPTLTGLDWAVLFFGGVACASFFVADFRHVALRELRVLLLEPILYYLMLRTSRLEERSVWRITDFFVLGAFLVAAIGLVQYGLGVDIITAEEGFRRLRSVYGSPNSVGLYLGRALPVVVAVALFGRSRGRRIAYGLAAVPLGLAVLLSFSKGALILGVPLSMLALGLLAGGRWLWVSLGGVVTAAVAAIPLLRTPRFASLLDTRSGSTFFRLQLWHSSWTMFREHPWLGVGPDNFLYQYRSRYILPAAWQEPDIAQAHNIFLDYATRMGLAGLAAGAWLQVAFWRLALPLRRLTDRDRRALAIGLMGSMVSFLAQGLVDASYFLIDIAFAFFLTLGMVQWLAVAGERADPDLQP